VRATRAGFLPQGCPGRGHTGAVTALTFGEVGGRTVIASGGADGTARLWDPATGTPAGGPLAGHTGTVTAVAIRQLDSGTVIVTGSDDATVRAWTATGPGSAERPPDGAGREAVRIDIDAQVYGLALLPPLGIAVATEFGVVVLDDPPW
jgi:WD40 repeat protein